MSDISRMFEYKGKTTKLIGETKAQTYQEIYNHLSKLQQNHDLSFNGAYWDSFLYTCRDEQKRQTIKRSFLEIYNIWLIRIWSNVVWF